MVYPALLPLMRTPRLPVFDRTDAPADLNGLVRFAERRNLVSAHVPSHFNWPLRIFKVKFGLILVFKGLIESSPQIAALQISPLLGGLRGRNRCTYLLQGEGESFRAHPGRFRGPFSVFHKPYRVFLRVVKRLGRDVDHPPSFRDERNVTALLLPASGPSWPVTE